MFGLVVDGPHVRPKRTCTETVIAILAGLLLAMLVWLHALPVQASTRTATSLLRAEFSKTAGGDAAIVRRDAPVLRLGVDRARRPEAQKRVRLAQGFLGIFRRRSDAPRPSYGGRSYGGRSYGGPAPAGRRYGGRTYGRYPAGYSRSSGYDKYRPRGRRGAASKLRGARIVSRGGSGVYTWSPYGSSGSSYGSRAGDGLWRYRLRPPAKSSGTRRRSFSRHGYRTMCVRLCDGYYWPVSFGASVGKFARDKDLCQSSCSAETELFYYSTAGGSIETMRSMSGKRYAKLKTAFKYRKSRNPTCRCRADPWSRVEKLRHAQYSLEERQARLERLAAKRAGAAGEDGAEMGSDMAGGVPKPARTDVDKPGVAGAAEPLVGKPSEGSLAGGSSRGKSRAKSRAKPAGTGWPGRPMGRVVRPRIVRIFAPTSPGPGRRGPVVRAASGSAPKPADRRPRAPKGRFEDLPKYFRPPGAR